MSFGKDIENFSSQFISSSEKLNQENVNKFLKELLGDEIILVKSYNFDGDTNKFTEIDAPDYLIKLIADAGYYDL